MGISIKGLRKQAGKTQKEMAEIAGISHVTWKKWEDNPDVIPHGTYLQLIEYLETAINIRKGIRMNEPTPATVRVLTAEQLDAEERDNQYTVPIPEGLTENFQPSQPVTDEQWEAWDARNVEPYPGFALEMRDWEDAWDEVNRAQDEADTNGHILVVPSLRHTRPDYDPETGAPLAYPDETIIVSEPGQGLDKTEVISPENNED